MPHWPRTKTFSNLAAALLCLTAARTLAAQQTIVGAWLMQYDHSSQASHSAVATPEHVQARLVLRQVGDSLFGDWQQIVAKGDTAPPPRNVHGVQRRDSVFLRFIPVVDVDEGMIANVLDGIVVFLKTYVHGMPPTTTAMDVALRGDTVTGTRRTVLLDGTPRGAGVVLTGVRNRP